MMTRDDLLKKLKGYRYQALRQERPELLSRCAAVSSAIMHKYSLDVEIGADIEDSLVALAVDLLGLRASGKEEKAT